ncbi:hypothetical protein BGZ51_007097 [Haplosporangium sp. Z 767]|nr:hypothetical protein BGZ51_007097 [Haplosporangium sp. Z 767]
MGACFGKPDRKSQGYVLGSANTSSNATATAGQRLGTTTNAKSKSSQPPQSAQSGQRLDGGIAAPSPSRTPGGLSPSALAAEKRAEAAEKRGVQAGGGKLAKKLAEEKKKSPYAIEEPVPEPTNVRYQDIIPDETTLQS